VIGIVDVDAAPRAAGRLRYDVSCPIYGGHNAACLDDLSGTGGVTGRVIAELDIMDGYPRIIGPRRRPRRLQKHGQQKHNQYGDMPAASSHCLHPGCGLELPGMPGGAQRSFADLLHNGEQWQLGQLSRSRLGFDLAEPLQ